MIQGTGSDSSKIMIVGDYPTKDDLRDEVALSGKPGNLLNYYLKSYGKSLDSVYRTLLLKDVIDEKLLKQKRTRRKYLDELLSTTDYRDILINEINTFKPNVIISLGEASLEFLTNEEGIDNFRGSILPIDPTIYSNNHAIKIVPTLHPRQIWERYEMMPIVRLDIGKAVEQEYNSKPIKRNELLWVVKSVDELRNYWQRAKLGEFLVFDIETYYDIISCIGFCSDGYETVCVPLIDPDINIQELGLIWEFVAQILNSNIPKCNQNITYDNWFCNKFGLTIKNITDDTMLLAHCIYPELPKKLAFLTSIYTDQPFYKDEGRSFDPRIYPKQQFYLYNAKDCLVTWQIFKKQIVDAQDLKVYSFYKNSIMKRFHIYRRLEKRGILVDEQKRQQLRDKYQAIYDIRYQNIKEIYGKDINIRSSQQVASLIYDDLKCSPHYHTTPNGNKALSTDKETLEEIYINEVSNQTVKTLLQQIIICRKVLTILNYINVIVHPDGRLRCTYNQAGTKNGRTSASYAIDRMPGFNEKNKFKMLEMGCSFQVLPKRPFECEELEGEIFGADIPSMFVPTPGYIFIEGDGKAAEAGVVCVLSEDYDTLNYMYHRFTTKKNQFNCSDDIHTLTAQWTTLKDFEAITKYDRETFGKRPRHAGNYDMTEYRLSTMIHRKVSTCLEILNRFHQRCPKIRAIFHTSIRQLIDNYHFLITPHGRRRDFFGRTNKDQYKEAYANIPQAVVTDHTCDTMVMLDEAMLGIEFLVEKHDSLLAEIKKEDAMKYAELFKKTYEREIDFSTGSMPREFKLVIPAELSWSENNWGDMKEIEL